MVKKCPLNLKFCFLVRNWQMLVCDIKVVYKLTQRFLFIVNIFLMVVRLCHILGDLDPCQKLRYQGKINEKNEKTSKVSV